MNLPEHITFSLEHNGHRDVGKCGRDIVAETPPAIWVSDAQRDKAAAEDSVWIARWIRTDGQVGAMAAADVDVLLAAIRPDTEASYGWVRRLELSIDFTTTLDPVPGWGHDPKDWITLATRDFERQGPFYGAKANVRAMMMNGVPLEVPPAA